jgi:hypothetical protein
MARNRRFPKKLICSDLRKEAGFFFLPRKKFNREQADKLWKNYTENLVASITEAEKEGLDKGYSSYEIETLWQAKVKMAVEKKADPEKEESTS